MISTKVYKVHEHENSLMYRANCDCSDPTHNTEFEITWDSEFNMIEFILRQTLYKNGILHFGIDFVLQ